jgi:uncharacterized membrane protein YbhN (UPF0104 family)
MASTLGTVTTSPTTVPRTAAAVLGPAPDTRVVDTGSQAPGLRSDRPRRSWARAAFVLLGVAALATIAVTRRVALAESVARLGHLRWAWVPVALGLEWASISVFARMQRRLLEAGGASVASRPMLATVYAANALSTSLPLAGPELGAAFTFRRFKKQGVDSPLAGWTLMVGGVISPLAGVFVFMTGALLSGNDVLAVLGVAGGLLGLAVIVVLHTAARRPRLRSTLELPASWVLARSRRLLRRPGGDPSEEVRAWGERLASLRPEPSVWMWVSVFALANWLTDAGVLAASIYAVGAAVPWQALLLVYGSGVLVRSLGITPGGLGLVEGTLCLGLVGAGVHVGLALASVLLYRFISFWMVAGAGWVVFLFLRGGGSVGAAMIPNPTLDNARTSGGVR